MASNKKQKTYSTKSIVLTSSIVVWVLLLAITNYPEWLGRHAIFIGKDHTPLPDFVAFLILFAPLLALSIPLAISLLSTEKKNLRFYYSQIAINVCGILIVSYVFYVLVNVLMHGLF